MQSCKAYKINCKYFTIIAKETYLKAVKGKLKSWAMSNTSSLPHSSQLYSLCLDRLFIPFLPIWLAEIHFARCSIFGSVLRLATEAYIYFIVKFIFHLNNSWSKVNSNSASGWAWSVYFYTHSLIIYTLREARQ